MADCVVCIEPRKHWITCPLCSFVSCESCVYNYIKEHPFQYDCMSCRGSWNLFFVVNHLSKKNLRSILSHRKQIKKARNKPHPLSSRLKELRIQKRIMEDKIKQLKQKMQKDLSIKPVVFCPSPCCDGQIGLDDRCFKCGLLVCKDCGEKNHSTHTCQGKSVDIKSCPSCKVPIERDSGCRNMYCTNCQTGFDWEEGKISKKVENPHFWEQTSEFARKRQQIMQSNISKRQLWLSFQELLIRTKAERAKRSKSDQTEKQSFLNELYLDLFIRFQSEGQTLIDLVLNTENEVVVQDLEFKMFDLMKDFNDKSLKLSEKLGMKTPRILGWQWV